MARRKRRESRPAGRAVRRENALAVALDDWVPPPRAVATSSTAAQPERSHLPPIRAGAPTRSEFKFSRRPARSDGASDLPAGREFRKRHFSRAPIQAN